MSAATSTLRQWRERAQPTRRVLRRALIGGLSASLVSSLLLTVAVSLLVFSATRPSWRSVAAWLVVVELLAFVRAPLRFNERLASHTLGYDAVTTWRRWLVTTVGQWSTTTWATHGSGDIADRALRDTDALSDLWVRGLLPLITSYVTLAVGDLATFVLTWRHAWWLAPALVLSQVLGGLLLRRGFNGLVRDDAEIRQARGALTTQIVDGASVVHDLALLRATSVVSGRIATALVPLERAEQRGRRRRRALTAVSLLQAAVALTLTLLAAPALSPLLVVGLAWLSLGSADLLDAAQAALQSLVAVTAAGERLDDLGRTRTPRGSRPWRDDTMTIEVDGHEVRELPRGYRLALTGPSGSGKTSLLLALAGLSDDPSPLLVGGERLSSYLESEVRRAVRYVPANPHLVRGYVRDVLAMGHSVSSWSWDQLRDVGLTLDPDQRLENLSRGERQRFAIVRALSTSPAIVLLDEPTGGLGIDDTERVLRLLEHTGVTVIVATHDPLVVAWCDDTVALSR